MTTAASARPIRVMIVDDSALVRHGIRSVLASHRGERPIEIVAEADGVDGALQTAVEAEPDVVLLDIRLRDGSGVDVCRQLLERLPEISVLMLTSFASDHLVYESIVAGAKGYLMKEIDPPGLFDAVQRAADGGAVLTSDATKRIMELVRKDRPAPEAELAKLSVQERRVLTLVAAGHTNRAIGEALTLSENTVKNYLANVFAKLGIKRRSHAAALFVQASRKSDSFDPAV